MEKYQLVYKIKKNKNCIRLLGNIFFNRNKTSGYFIYNNGKHPLKEKFETRTIKKEKLKIYLIFHKIITNKSYMFQECEDLLYFNQYNSEDIHYFPWTFDYHEEKEEENLFAFYDKYEISESTLYQEMDKIDSSLDFYSSITNKPQNNSKCSTIQYYNNFLESNNYQKNTISLTNMFYKCFSLQSIPDIY